MTAAAIVTAVVVAVCVAGVAALCEWSRRCDRRDADRRAAQVVEEADRIVREYERRMNHPSQWKAGQ